MDGTPGGAIRFNFSTISVRPIPGTVVTNLILDPGPDDAVHTGVSLVHHHKRASRLEPGVTNGVMTIRDANGNEARDANGVPVDGIR